jgi:Lar family restriction alleviation protein
MKNLFKKDNTKKPTAEPLELKPCPFCGGKAAICENFCHAVAAVCKNCNARTQSYEASTEFAAVEKVAEVWNRRAGR